MNGCQVIAQMQPLSLLYSTAIYNEMQSEAVYCDFTMVTQFNSNQFQFIFIIHSAFNHGLKTQRTKIIFFTKALKTTREMQEN